MLPTTGPDTLSTMLSTTGLDTGSSTESLHTSTSSMSRLTPDKMSQSPGTSAPTSASTTERTASRSDSESENSLNLNCHVCTQIYTIPKVLNCVHAFCQQCLQKDTHNEAKNVKCPKCHRETPIPPSGLAGLLTDYARSNKIEKEALENPNVKSTCCSQQNNKAVSKCLQCEIFLCWICDQQHENMNCFDNHQVVTLSELRKPLPPARSIKKPIYCLRHKTKDLKFFCRTCRVAVCTDCYTDDHYLHSFVDMDSEYAEQELVAMKELAQQATAKVADLRTSNEKIKQAGQVLNVNYMLACDAIHANHKYFMDVVDERKNEALKELAGAFNVQKQNLNDASFHREGLLKDALRGSKFADNLKRFASDKEILVSKKLIEENIAPMMLCTPDINYASASSLEFSSNQTAIQTAVRNSFGYVLKSVNDTESTSSNKTIQPTGTLPMSSNRPSRPSDPESSGTDALAIDYWNAANVLQSSIETLIETTGTLPMSSNRPSRPSDPESSGTDALAIDCIKATNKLLSESPSDAFSGCVESNHLNSHSLASNPGNNPGSNPGSYSYQPRNTLFPPVTPGDDVAAGYSNWSNGGDLYGIPRSTPDIPLNYREAAWSSWGTPYYYQNQNQLNPNAESFQPATEDLSSSTCAASSLFTAPATSSPINAPATSTFGFNPSISDVVSGLNWLYPGRAAILGSQATTASERIAESGGYRSAESGGYQADGGGLRPESRAFRADGGGLRPESRAFRAESRGFRALPMAPSSSRTRDVFSTINDPIEDLDVPARFDTANTHPPKSQITRQKMIYHNKFGEFGAGNSQFTEPSGVAINADNDIIVADTNNHRVQIFDREGRFKFEFGQHGKEDGMLMYPNRVAVVKNTGDIVITERCPTHQVQIFNKFGYFVRKFGASILTNPRGLAVDDQGRIIVIECKVMKVFIFDQMGNMLRRFHCSRYLDFPNAVAVNDIEEIFITDNTMHCVKVFNYRGEYLREIGGIGLTNYPIGVGINSLGQLLIADNHNNFNVTIFTQEGQFINALESKVKHAQCYNVALMYDDASIVLASKDYRLYIYRYTPIATSLPAITNGYGSSSEMDPSNGYGSSRAMVPARRERLPEWN